MNGREEIRLDETEKTILNIIQSGFPIAPRPYAVIGGLVGLSEEEALGKVRGLREKGFIRRIGGNFSSRSVGYASTLCAARAPEDKLPRFIQAVNKFPGVTHNYRRKHDLNVWFTFIAPSMEDIERNLRSIAEESGVSEIHNMPAIRTFKIKVDFRFEEAGE